MERIEEQMMSCRGLMEAHWNQHKYKLQCSTKKIIFIDLKNQKSDELRRDKFGMKITTNKMTFHNNMNHKFQVHSSEVDRFTY